MGPFFNTCDKTTVEKRITAVIVANKFSTSSKAEALNASIQRTARATIDIAASVIRTLRRPDIEAMPEMRSKEKKISKNNRPVIPREANGGRTNTATTIITRKIESPLSVAQKRENDSHILLIILIYHAVFGCICKVFLPFFYE
jgi:hypothetical protein